jgi:phosphatidylinositol glycan class K
MGSFTRWHILVLVLVVCVQNCFAAKDSAILIDTSRLWSNYRHTANVLTFYSHLRELGYPNDRILLFLAGDVPCHSMNCKAGSVFHSRGQNLFGAVYSDFKGDEISRERVARVLKRKQVPWTPRERRLSSGENSNVFVFITGHSGIGFAKIQDAEEYSAADIADTIHEMSELGWFGNMAWFGDTCRAASLHNEFYSPNVLAVGSSQERQSSYSKHGDTILGTSVIDRFSYYSASFINQTLRNRANSSLTISDFTKRFDFEMLMSNISYRTDLVNFETFPDKMIDFLGYTVSFHASTLSVGKFVSHRYDHEHHTAVASWLKTSFKSNPESIYRTTPFHLPIKQDFTLIRIGSLIFPVLFLAIYLFT